MAAFNGDYQQLATALLVQAGVAGAAGGGAGGGAAAAPEPVAKYAGDYMDIEKVEASAQRWLSENCVDTNATVLQNVRVFMDHISNVYKDKVYLYETRDDMERLAPDAPNPNAFSDMVDRLCKLHNDNHPLWRTDGDDIRPARFEYLPEKVVPCALNARRRHGAKTGPPNGGPGNESCRGMYQAGNNKSAFWKAHIQYPQLPEYTDFHPAANGISGGARKHEISRSRSN